MAKLKRLLASILPMRFCGYAFTDIVTGNAVGYYRQIDGAIVLAEGPLRLFRVESHGYADPY